MVSFKNRFLNFNIIRLIFPSFIIGAILSNLKFFFPSHRSYYILHILLFNLLSIDFCVSRKVTVRFFLVPCISNWLINSKGHSFPLHWSFILVIIVLFLSLISAHWSSCLWLCQCINNRSFIINSGTYFRDYYWNIAKQFIKCLA